MAKETVLVVEDQEPAREMLREFVESELGYTCQTAANGIQGLDMVERQSFALVISDVRMPEMDGVELLKRIKKIKPDQPVVIVTAFGDKYSFVDMVEAGANDFILKPFDLAELKAKIVRVLRERALLMEQRALVQGLRAKIEELQYQREEVQSLRKQLERQAAEIVRLKQENENLRQASGS